MIPYRADSVHFLMRKNSATKFMCHGCWVRELRWFQGFCLCGSGGGGRVWVQGLGLETPWPCIVGLIVEATKMETQ